MRGGVDGKLNGWAKPAFLWESSFKSFKYHLPTSHKLHASDVACSFFIQQPYFMTALQL